MKVKTPNNENIQPYLEPDTVYDAEITEGGFVEYTNHLLLNLDGTPSLGYGSLKGCLHLNGQDWIVVQDMENRQFLQDFIKLNQIKTTLVSKYLGHSPSWLTTMANEKRRGDLSDESLKAILKKLHIDWSSNEFINVKATKEHTAYRTRPCTYTTNGHKERLQKAMWNGCAIHG